MHCTRGIVTSLRWCSSTSRKSARPPSRGVSLALGAASLHLPLLSGSSNTGWITSGEYSRLCCFCVCVNRGLYELLRKRSCHTNSAMKKFGVVCHANTRFNAAFRRIVRRVNTSRCYGYYNRSWLLPKRAERRRARKQFRAPPPSQAGPLCCYVCALGARCCPSTGRCWPPPPPVEKLLVDHRSPG